MPDEISEKKGGQTGTQPRSGPLFSDQSIRHVVLVTGAGRGTGRAVAVALGEQGAAVCVNDINPDSAAETVRLVEAAGGRGKTYLADVSKKFPVQAMFNAIEDDWGLLDAAVHCARVAPRRPILEMDEWEWRRTLDVNLTGAFNVLQVGGRVMAAGGGGVVVLVVEAAGDLAGLGAVEAARRGVVGLGEAVKEELAGAGVRVEGVMIDAGNFEGALKKVVGFVTDL